MTRNVQPGSAGTIVVFGGSGGLGSAICQTLAEGWAAVRFTAFRGTDRAERLAAKLSNHCEASWVKADLRSEDDVTAALTLPENASPLRGIVFAAGMDIAQPYVSQIEQDSWEQVVNLEVLGFTRVVRLALPILRQAGGVLVTVGSFATHRFPPGDAISAVPKAAMEMLTRAIAREEGRYGIRANTVGPGIIDEGLGKLVQERAHSKEIWDDQRRRVPLRRFGAASEVADAVAFLASDRASYITGQTILVDGGLHI